MLLFAALLLVVLAGILFWQAGRRRKAAGLPGGRVIYSDTRGWGPVEEPLYDPDLGLVGKPDYLVQQGEVVIPVEVKTARRVHGPYDGHIFQLAAYCKLVEHAYGTRPPYGLLHYTSRGEAGPGQTFAIDFTPELETALLDLLAEMRQHERKREVARSHESPARCAGCGYRGLCDQSLAD
jgi:CRISPR-associated exonuclease Cas4